MVKARCLTKRTGDVPLAGAGMSLGGISAGLNGGFPRLAREDSGSGQLLNSFHPSGEITLSIKTRTS